MATLSQRLKQKLNNPDDTRSVSGRARAKRWDRLLLSFPDLAEMRVLDLGGLPGFWLNASVRPAEVTTVNLVEAESPGPWLRHLVDDACGPTGLGAETFDLVVSNSLIEHVGGYTARRRLADVIRSSAPRHWVQTPYRYFPVEPHWVFPGLQFLPPHLRAKVIPHWPFGHSNLDYHGALDAALACELLSLSEMRLLFPDSFIWHEKVAGLTKSLVAIRQLER
ncbi:class I SAM-dependent methyltransferase [Actinokineospora enzanensis]|uniref:class I SAM-dependent methyltransferase n=1 Tax=Actinokineospora enzanensis TaxID=155975 RepID=UPI001B7F810A|nr:class I SAM-dependent methyltransferase [Actinokineospora enzanensis]